MIWSFQYMTLKSYYCITHVRKRMTFAIYWHTKYSSHFHSLLKLERHWWKGIRVSCSDYSLRKPEPRSSLRERSSSQPWPWLSLSLHSSLCLASRLSASSGAFHVQRQYSKQSDQWSWKHRDSKHEEIKKDLRIKKMFEKSTFQNTKTPECHL